MTTTLFLEANSNLCCIRPCKRDCLIKHAMTARTYAYLCLLLLVSVCPNFAHFGLETFNSRPVRSKCLAKGQGREL